MRIGVHTVTIYGIKYLLNLITLGQNHWWCDRN